MNRSSARLRRAFALVVAIGVAVLGGVAWTTHEQSVRLDETAGWADRTRASVAAVQAVSLVPQLTQVALALQIWPAPQSPFVPQLPCTQVPVEVWQT